MIAKVLFRYNTNTLKNALFLSIQHQDQDIEILTYRIKFLMPFPSYTICLRKEITMILTLLYFSNEVIFRRTQFTLFLNWSIGTIQYMLQVDNIVIHNI